MTKLTNMNTQNINTYLTGTKISSLLLLLICALVLAACSDSKEDDGNSGSTTPDGTTPGDTTPGDTTPAPDRINNIGLIRYCNFDLPASYSFNGVLPINEDSMTECELHLPRNEAINSVPPSNLTVSIIVAGRAAASIFPAGRITYGGSDATASPIPLADADGALITNINLTLNPAKDTFGRVIINFVTYDTEKNQVLGALIYPINIVAVDDAPSFTAAEYNFTTIAAGFKGKVLGGVAATIPVDNPNQDAPNYAFAQSNGATDDSFTIDASTGIIALKRSLVPDDAGNYVFNVIANQDGTTEVGIAEVTITILSIDGDEDGDGFTNAYDAAPDNVMVNVSGTGTPTDPYIISNIYQLQAIDGVDHTQTHLSDEGSATGGNWLYSPDCTDDQSCRTAQLASSYQLSNDIDAAVTRGWNNGRGFYPIGYEDNPFTEVLNGAGFAVHNLFINRTENGRVKGAIGLFAFAIDAQIMDFGMENVNITVTIPADTKDTSVEISGLIGAIGFLVGNNLVAINLNHVYVTGVIQVMNESGVITYAGGLIGGAVDDINITNSYTIVNIIGGTLQGGLVGQINGGKTSIITNSYSLNRITPINFDEGGHALGGLVGKHAITLSITSSYTVSNITHPDIAVSLVDGSGREISDNASYWFSETDGNIRVPLAGYKDAKGLSRMQLQNCGLDGFQFDGAADEVCEGLFPSGTATDPLWRDRIEDGVTTYWDFSPADEYPYLTTTPDANGNTLLPTVAEQRCQRNRFFYDRPCATE